MRKKQPAHAVDTLFTALLLLSFLLFAVLLAETGAAVYRKGADHLNENYCSRTALSYLSEKARQHDCSGAIFSAKVGECPALALKEQRENDVYQTYIYFYDNALRELFTRETTAVLPEMGSVIAQLSDFSFELEAAEDGGQLLTVHVTDPDGTVHSACIHLSSKGDYS